jgi:3-hydroxybutyryl-CoA dehydrogenase
MSLIKTVGIIGAGTMGSGIAQICALAGYDVLLYDNTTEAIDKAKSLIEGNLFKGIDRGKITQAEAEQAKDNITFVHKLEKVKADIIIEAIIEDLTVKQELFAALEKNNEANTILATNTSSIPITKIAATLQKPERLIGLHFFNPAHIMKLVEVISGAATAQKVVETTRRFAESLGKTVVEAKDSPGFIVNRVARHFYVESLQVLESGVANIEAIDRLVESSGFKLGPFKLMDLIGVNTNLSVTQSMYDGFNQESKFRPNRIQQQKVDAGHWGRKTGRGFYDYEK